MISVAEVRALVPVLPHLGGMNLHKTQLLEVSINYNMRGTTAVPIHRVLMEITLNEI